MTDLSLEQLQGVFVGSRVKGRLAEFLPHLNAAMREYGILEPIQVAHFLAQLGHESGSFNWIEEIWGPTADQKGYEGRRDLGNIHPGDGYRFRGRGPIQITGRHNYTTCGQALGLLLHVDPDLLLRPENGMRAAGWFWKSRNLSAVSLADDIRAVTRIVNGGFNGLADRQAYLTRAKRVLGLAKGTVRPLLKQGQSGPEVARLQGALNKFGYKLGQDGVFGPMTYGAVIDFQRRRGLAVDGLVGPNTWRELG